MPKNAFSPLLRPRIREQLPKPLKDAGNVQLARALIENHRAWRTRLARAARGVVHAHSGLDWMHAPDIETGLAITGMTEEDAAAQLAEAFAFFARKRNPIPVTVTAGDSSGPRDLIGRLVAWGVPPAFQPGMAADLERLGKIDIPKDVTLSLCETPDQTLPQSNPKSVAARFRAQTMRPRRVWHILAQRNRKPLGRIALHIAAGVAGLYDLNVQPEARGQGIGSTLALGACLFAQKLGYRHAVLTAAQTALFRRIGFGKVGRMLISTPPSDRLRGRPNERDLEIACTASTGERGRFCKLLRQYPKAMAWRSRTGLTPIHIAVAAGRPDFACWLLDRGAELDPETARELGLR